MLTETILVMIIIINSVLAQNAGLQYFMQSVAEKAIKLAENAELLFNEGCNKYTECSESFVSCKQNLNLTLTCIEDFKGISCSNKDSFSSGKMLSLDNSIIQLQNKNYQSPKQDLNDYDIKRVVCSFSKLNSDFKEIRTNQNFNLTKWIYIGSYNGVHRSYPGTNRCDADIYDPRDRPWYASASSGSKNLIIVIDNSITMDDQKLDFVKSLVERIINSTTSNDAIGIIKFSDEVETYKDRLVKAKSDEKTDLKKYVKNTNTTNKIPNYEKAINKIYGLFENTSELLSSCQKFVLFFSDGDSTVKENNSAIVKLINNLDKNYNSTWLNFVIGAEYKSNPSFFQPISCLRNGITFRMSGRADEQQIMNRYFLLLSYGKFPKNDAFWVDPYVDQSDLGNITTISVPVYFRSVSPEFLIGVVGIDVSLQDIYDKYTKDAADKIISDYTNNYPCSLLKLTECELESLRGDFKCSENVSTCLNLPKSVDDFCNFKINTSVYKKADSLYINENKYNCCLKEDKNFPIWAIIVIILGAIVLLILIFLLARYCHRRFILQD